jgi:hypothetical protein
MTVISTFCFPSTGVAVLWTIAALLLIPILKLASLLIKPYFSNLRDLPGPPGGGWITGHIPDMNKSETDRAECHLNWLKQYGHVLVYKSLLNVRASFNKNYVVSRILMENFQSDRLVTVDPKALNHILANPMIYYKPAHLRLTLGQLIGEGTFQPDVRTQSLITKSGLIFAEGKYSARQHTRCF